MSNREDPLQIVAAGVDTLVLKAELLLDRSLESRLFESLQRLREHGKCASIDAAGHSFTLERKSLTERLFLTSRAGLELIIATSTARDDIVYVTANLGPRFLWSMGPVGATDRAMEVVESMGTGRVNWQVSTIHVAVDVQGTKKALAFPSRGKPNWVKRIRRGEDMFDGNRVIGHRFGAMRSDSFQLSIYDKQFILRRSDDAFIRQIWKSNGGDPIARTMRIEARIGRDMIRSINPQFLRYPSDVLELAEHAWKTVTRKISLRSGTRKSRWDRATLDPRWSQLQQVSLFPKGHSLPPLPPPRVPSEERLLNQILGCITSLVAIRRNLDEAATVTDIINRLKILGSTPGTREAILKKQNQYYPPDESRGRAA